MPKLSKEQIDQLDPPKAKLKASKTRVRLAKRNVKQFLKFYETNEHTQFGVGLRFQGLKEGIKNQPLLYIKDRKLVENTALKMTPGQIIAYAGDFFAAIQAIARLDPNKKFSPKGADKEYEKHFLNAFKDLAGAKKSEFDKAKSLQDNPFLQKNPLLQQFAFMIGLKDYYPLLKNNYDHFAPWAQKAYEVGHKAAMKMAKLAKTKGDDRYLRLAYQMDLFACHFLTDSFAGGHLRLGLLREELGKQFGTLGSILVNCMHNEDNKLGVNVIIKGKPVLMKGDSHLQNVLVKPLIKKAVQASMDEVYGAYDKNLTTSNMNSRFPKLDKKQNAPMFKLKKGKIYYRDPIDDLNPSNVKYKKLTSKKAFELAWQLRVASVKPTKKKNILETTLKKVQDLLEKEQKELPNKWFSGTRAIKNAKIKILKKLQGKLDNLNKEDETFHTRQNVEAIFKGVRNDMKMQSGIWKKVSAGLVSHRVRDLFEANDALTTTSSIASTLPHKLL